MPAKKKILASEVYVGNISVEAQLLSLAEQAKENDARCAAILQENQAILQEMRDLGQRMDRNERDIHNIAQALMTMAQRMEQTEREIPTIAQAMMMMAQRMDARLGALEARSSVSEG